MLKKPTSENAVSYKAFKSKLWNGKTSRVFFWEIAVKIQSQKTHSGKSNLQNGSENLIPENALWEIWLAISRKNTLNLFKQAQFPA